MRLPLYTKFCRGHVLKLRVPRIRRDSVPLSSRIPSGPSCLLALPGRIEFFFFFLKVLVGVTCECHLHGPPRYWCPVLCLELLSLQLVQNLQLDHVETGLCDSESPQALNDTLGFVKLNQRRCGETLTKKHSPRSEVNFNITIIMKVNPKNFNNNLKQS